MNWPKLILLNGSSSAGKSTLASLLQTKITDVPYLIFGFDSLVFMSPKRFWEDAATPQQSESNKYLKEGVHMVHREKPGEPIEIEAVFGPTFNTLIASMPEVVRTLIDAGNYVIFDHIIHNKTMYEQYEQHLQDIDQIRVGVHCDLTTLEQREKERGDRVIGRARGLYHVVHQYTEYDLNVHTDKESTDETLEKILDAIKSLV